MKTSEKRDMLLIISSFLIGGLVMLIFVKIINMGSYNNYIVDKKNTKVYEKTSLSSSIEKIYNAVVLIQVIEENEIKSNGTGFIYKVDEKYGYIITNEHVVKTDTVKITFSNDKETTGKILGKDEYLDLAVVRIDKRYVSGVAIIGNSTNTNLGDVVYTVGSPLGYNYRGSVTSGILSGKNRLVSTSVSDSDNSDWVMKVLQVDASINPGNSGGPLLNINGEVIGICTLKLINDEIEGMGFAIPIEEAMPSIEKLEKGEKIKWPKIGIDMTNVKNTSSLYRNNITIPESIKSGVVVLDIEKSSSASTSNLKKGDVIIKVDNNPTKDVGYLKYELYKHKIGDKVEITYIRNGKEAKTTIEIKD